jgi:hypothetical protein
MDTIILLLILATLVIYLLYLITQGSEAQVKVLKKLGISAKSIKQEIEDNERVLKKRMADLREFEVWLNQELPTFSSLVEASIMSGGKSVITSFYGGKIKLHARYNAEKEKVIYTYFNWLTNINETFETFDKFQEFYYLNRKKMLSSIKKDMVNKDFEEV